MFTNKFYLICNCLSLIFGVAIEILGYFTVAVTTYGDPQTFVVQLILEMFQSSSNRLLSSLLNSNYGAIRSSTNNISRSSVRLFSSMRATVKPVSKRKFIPSRTALILSPNAVSRIKEVLKDQPGAIGLRVTVKQKGCNGLTYHLDYAKEKNKLDEEVVQDGVSLFLDSKALLTLLGTEMDFVETKLSSEFVFKNPNVKGTCGCGESFTI